MRNLILHKFFCEIFLGLGQIMLLFPNIILHFLRILANWIVYIDLMGLELKLCDIFDFKYLEHAMKFSARTQWFDKILHSIIIICLLWKKIVIFYSTTSYKKLILLLLLFFKYYYLLFHLPTLPIPN